MKGSNQYVAAIEYVQPTLNNGVIVKDGENED